MMNINHKIFGDLKFNSCWWEKEEYIYLCGKKNKVNIAINGEKDAEFEQMQMEAYEKFFTNLDNLMKYAEQAIYDYYQEMYQDYRDKLEADIDKFAPIVNSVADMQKLVELKEIIFPWTFGKPIRKVGLLLSCTWESENGLAVVFENEKVVDVGDQDIIL